MKFKFIRIIGMSYLSELVRLVRVIQLTEFLTIYASAPPISEEVQNLHRPYISDFTKVSYLLNSACYE